MAGDAVTSKSAILSESAMVSECEQEGEGSLFRNVFWMLARSIVAPGDCLVSGDSRPHWK